MSDQITYDDKADLQVATNIANINKVTASDMNEIKNVVNSHADDIDVANNNITQLHNNKLDIADVLNQASTDTDKPYSADYLNDKLVSVGATAPTDGERVWFKYGKNLISGWQQGFWGTADGSYNGTRNDYICTYKIPVKPNTTYTYRHGIGETIIYVMQYGKNDNYLSYQTFNSSQVQITTSENTYYIGIDITKVGQAISPSDMREGQLEEGPATSYEPYIEQSIKVDNEDFISMDNLVSVGINQPSDGKRVWFKKSNNLLPTNKYISTKTINGVTFTNNGDGTFNLVGTATANTSNIIIPVGEIELEVNQPYYLYSSVPYNVNTFSLSIAMTENSTSKFILANNTYTPSTTPTNVRLQFYIPSGTTVNATNVKLMLVKGNTAPSVYEPYVKPAIYVDGVKIYEMS